MSSSLEDFFGAKRERFRRSGAEASFEAKVQREGERLREEIQSAIKEKRKPRSLAEILKTSKK